MKSINRFLFSLCLLLLSSSIQALDLDFTPHLEQQFHKLQAYNASCIRNKQLDQRVYLFIYEPGKSIDFGQVSASYDWFNYYLLPNSGRGLFDEHSLTYLNERLKAFNQVGEEVAQGHSEPVEIYAFFINDFKGYMDANPAQLINNEKGSILAYLAQEKGKIKPDAYEDYAAYRKALRDRVNQFDFGAGENKLLIYGSGFKAYRWKKQHERIYTINTSAKGAYLESSALCRKIYQEESWKSRQFPFHFPTQSKASRHFANSILSQLEFLSSPNLQQNCEACGPALAGYLEQLWDPVARNFLRDRCEQLKDFPERLAHAYSIAQFIQSLGTIYDDYASQSLPPDEYNWSGAWEEYLTFEEALNDHETQIRTAHDRLRKAVATADWYQVFLALCHFKRSIYFESLSVEDRIEALEVLSSGPMLGYWLLGDHEALVLSLLNKVPDEPLYIDQLLNGLKASPGLLRTLFKKINNHWVGEASRFKFVSSLHQLVKKRPNINQVTTDYTLIWDLPDQYVLNSFDYQVEFSDQGMLDFQFKKCVAVDQSHNNIEFGNYARPFCIEKEQEVWQQVDPFGLMDIAVLDRITVIDVCEHSGCQGKVFKQVPAIIAAYLIEQTSMDNRLDQVMNTLEVAGLALGVGELTLALKLGSRLRLLIAGYILASDISSVTISSQAFKTFLLAELGEEEGNKLYEHLLFFNTINSVIAGTVGLVALEDAAKAVASVDKLKEIGVDLEQIEDQLGFSLGNLTGEELKQLASSMRTELNSTSEGQQALRAAKTGLGLDELAQFIQQLKNAGASEELINKIILLPLDDIELLLSQLLRNNQRLIPKFNATTELVNIWKSYRQSPDWENVVRWEEPLFYQHFSDLDISRSLRTLFQDHPRMTRAYAILSGDGSFDYLPFRTNIEDIKIIDEYLEVYPNRLDQLKGDFVGAGDKKAFIKGLLGPGKAGEKIFHRVRGLWESIDIRYQPSDAHLSEFELAPNLMLTEVNPPQGGTAGHYKRYWEPATNTFVLDEGFRYDAPKWIKDVPVPLVEGKGIPTSTYATLRQIKYLQIAEGGIQKLKLSLVQNAEIMRDIYFIMQENNLLNLQEAGDYLLSKSGIQYAVTMIKQAGYDISQVKILDEGYTHYLTTREIRDKKHVAEITDQWLQQNNLTWNSRFYIHFNVILELTPIP